MLYIKQTNIIIFAYIDSGIALFWEESQLRFGSCKVELFGWFLHYIFCLLNNPVFVLLVYNNYFATCLPYFTLQKDNL